MKLLHLLLSLCLMACNRQENATNEHKISFFSSKTTPLLNPDSKVLKKYLILKIILGNSFAICHLCKTTQKYTYIMVI